MKFTQIRTQLCALSALLFTRSLSLSGTLAPVGHAAARNVTNFNEPESAQQAYKPSTCASFVLVLVLLLVRSLSVFLSHTHWSCGQLTALLGPSSNEPPTWPHSKTVRVRAPYGSDVWGTRYFIWNWYKTQTQNALSKREEKENKKEKPKWWKFTVWKFKCSVNKKLLQPQRTASNRIAKENQVKWSENGKSK